LITTKNAHEVQELRVIGRGRIRSAALSPDNKIRAVGTSQGTWLYSMDELGEPPSLLTPSCGIGFRFTPNGQMLIAADTPEATTTPGTIRIWDISKGVEHRVLRGHTGMITHILLHPDGTRLVSGDHIDDAILVWDVSTGQLLSKVQMPEISRNFAFTQDGSKLAYGWTGEIHVLDFKNLNELFTLVVGGEIGHIGFSPDGKYVNVDENLWDIESRSFVGTLFIPGWRLLTKQFSSDSTSIMYARLANHHNVSEGSSNIEISMRNIETGSEQVLAQCKSTRDVLFSSDMAKMTTFNTDGSISCWSIQDCKELTRSTIEFLPNVSSITFGIDGRTILAASAVGLLKWDIETGELLVRIPEAQ
jgi:WD40 repeat protein